MEQVTKGCLQGFLSWVVASIIFVAVGLVMVGIAIFLTALLTNF